MKAIENLKRVCAALVILLLISTMTMADIATTKIVAQNELTSVKQKNHIPVCPPDIKGDTRCHSRVIVDEHGNPLATAVPNGYGPAQFLGGYNLTGNATSKQIIAIVDAFDDPNILSDLNTYSNTFGISTMNSCSGPISSSTSPCFQKVNQRGGTSYPQKNSGWALEISLDVEIAHAICQNCSILLVEADSNSLTNLGIAVNEAAALGATVISNSYGTGEFSGERSYDGYYNHPGIAVTVSSGDSGYGVQYPAASQNVTAVGGTTLNLLNGNSYLSETAWSGSGSGCSAFEPQPYFQTNLGLTGCSNRIVTDVSADADPSTGAAVYDTVRYFGRSGWYVVGGTSLSSPLIAGVYALAGNANSNSLTNSIPYILGNGANIHDITSGSNGNCGGTYLCTAVSGYDGPTGLGTPNGHGAY